VLLLVFHFMVVVLGILLKLLAGLDFLKEPGRERTLAAYPEFDAANTGSFCTWKVVIIIVRITATLINQLIIFLVDWYAFWFSFCIIFLTCLDYGNTGLASLLIKKFLRVTSQELVESFSAEAARRSCGEVPFRPVTLRPCLLTGLPFLCGYLFLQQ
jgi:hypothetical protein